MGFLVGIMDGRIFRRFPYMELFEPILHFFEQRWVHDIIWAAVLALGTAIAAKVASKTLRHLLNRDDNPLPASSIFITSLVLSFG